MIKIINGDILDALENIIVHQVNCQGVMGSGLAKQIRDKYPVVYKEYKKLVNWQMGEYEKGLAKQKYLLSHIQIVKVEDNKFICNLFGQLNYGINKIHTDYDALREGLLGLHHIVNNNKSLFYGYSIAIPYGLGCGLGGGDWTVVYKIIYEVFDDYEVTIYKLKEI